MKNTTIITEYEPAGAKMLMDEDKKNLTTYYWSPEMGLMVAENQIGDIGIVYKTKETISDDIDEVLEFIEENSENSDVLSINLFNSVAEAREFIRQYFKLLSGQQA